MLEPLSTYRRPRPPWVPPVVVLVAILLAILALSFFLAGS